jgi:hypothetical protein
VLPGAENPHLDGVHDADGKPDISGIVVPVTPFLFSGAIPGFYLNAPVFSGRQLL